MTLFDVYIAVDWSAAKTPGRGTGTIWIARRRRDETATVENPVTRAAATDRVRELIDAAADTGDRVLVGFDFAYGYPSGFADAVTPGRAPPWRRVWDELDRLVVDEHDNRNNRHSVAAGLNDRLGRATFWGSGDAKLPATKPRAMPLPELRLVERELRRHGAHPKAVWQLSYAGSVGSQTLLGIPRVRSLRDDSRLAPLSAVWPFETGFSVPTDTQIVHAEIYPTIGAAGARLHDVADAHQVLSTVALWWELDRDGSLGRLFGPPPGLDDAEAAIVSREEGWILGASPLLWRGAPSRQRIAPSMSA